jgi:hypothetical protein
MWSTVESVSSSNESSSGGDISSNYDRSIINASVVARRGYAEYFATLSIMTPKNATIDDFVAVRLCHHETR